MNDLKQLAAVAALNNMMQQGYVSICGIDTIGQMLGVNPKCEAYKILHALHCVNFDKMAPELRAQIPDLIQQCLSAQPTYVFKAHALKSPIIDVTPEPETKRSGFMRLIQRSL